MRARFDGPTDETMQRFRCAVGDLGYPSPPKTVHAASASSSHRGNKKKRVASASQRFCENAPQVCQDTPKVGNCQTFYMDGDDITALP